VFVPTEWQDASRDASRDVSADTSRDVSLVIEALKQQQEHEREAWRKQIDHERARADRAEQGRDELRDRIDTLNAKLSAARDAEGRACAETDVLARRVNELTEAHDARRGVGRGSGLRGGGSDVGEVTCPPFGEAGRFALVRNYAIAACAPRIKRCR
jgi:hypothetical protein